MLKRKQQIFIFNKLEAENFISQMINQQIIAAVIYTKVCNMCMTSVLVLVNVQQLKK